MQIKIANDIYYVGVNDRRKTLFENLWPLPDGVSYNSFLITDEKTALMDTVDICYSDLFFRQIEEALNGRPLDYLVVNHMEPDHSGSIRLLRQLYPGLQIVGNRQTFGMLAGYYGITEGLHEVREGEVLDLGRHRLKFYMAPMVHWPEVMVAYDETDKTLFSADAFGTYGTLDGGVTDSQINTDRYREEMIRYYANIVGKYGNPVQKLLQKLSLQDIQTICPTHGPVWHERRTDAIHLYDRLCRYEGATGVTILYGSMYGHTEQMAETVAASLSEQGIREIAMHDASKTHASYMLRDVFKYRGLMVGSPTYSGQLFPAIESVLKQIEVREVKNRLFGYFGSFTWAGMAVKRLAAFAETMKWETAGEPVEQKQAMSDESRRKCRELGKVMAERMLSFNDSKIQ
ncbi:MAG: FprA family A-type flavoprotein [Tannerella sp.]|jgi:flavorubredoxin|nr:FprA family A-type flavoprotein [Tannerella sp.]